MNQLVVLLAVVLDCATERVDSMKTVESLFAVAHWDGFVSD